MTQLTLSDELASALTAKAESRKCTTDALLETMLFRLESEEAFSERMLTPALQERMLTDLKRDRREFTSNEEVDRKFEALFHELESR